MKAGQAYADEQQTQAIGMGIRFGPASALVLSGCRSPCCMDHQDCILPTNRRCTRTSRSQHRQTPREPRWRRTRARTSCDILTSGSLMALSCSRQKAHYSESISPSEKVSFFFSRYLFATPTSEGRGRFGRHIRRLSSPNTARFRRGSLKPTESTV